MRPQRKIVMRDPRSACRANRASQMAEHNQRYVVVLGRPYVAILSSRLAQCCLPVHLACCMAGGFHNPFSAVSFGQ
jgi:hypothetical protein